MSSERKMCIKKMFLDRLYDIEAKYRGKAITSNSKHEINYEILLAMQSVLVTMGDKFGYNFTIDFDSNPCVPIITFENDFNDWLDIDEDN